MLLTRVFGDGKEWIALAYADKRPDYYLARVPTGTHTLIEHRAAAWYDILREIEQAIAEEAVEFYGARQRRERDAKGCVCDTRKWPIPPATGAGVAWWIYEPSEALLNEHSNPDNHAQVAIA